MFVCGGIVYHTGNMIVSEDLLVYVRGLIPTPSGSGVFLGADDRDKTIAIFIDPSVAACITMFLQDIDKPRPLTHDLIGNVFTGLGIEVLKIVVNDFKDETFFARIFLKQESELGTNFLEIDSRPSDAIAIALQQGAPVFVSTKVWDAVDDMGWALTQAEKDSQVELSEDDDSDDFDYLA